MGVLTVTLEKVMNLRDKDRLGRTDPYVRFELKKDRIGLDKSYGKKESSRKSGTCNPEYNETFTWNDVDSLNNMELVVKVMDEDVGLDDAVGYVELDLEHANISDTPKPVTLVIDPKRFSVFKTEATIHLQVSFE
jgi:Ca2+-dependent lipid-binding protein